MSVCRSTCSTIFLAKYFPNCKFLNYHYLRVKLWYAANTCQTCNLSVLKDLSSAQSPNKRLNRSISLSAFSLFFCLFLVYKKVVVQLCSAKIMLWKFSNIHRKYPVLESLFNKVFGLEPLTLLKKRLRHRSIPVNIPVNRALL